MHRRSLTACFLSLLLLTGCGSNPESLMKQQIDLMNETATAIENDEPQSKLESLQKRGESLTKKMEALDLTQAEQRELAEKHSEALAKAMMRLQNAMMEQMSESLGGPFGEGMPGLPGVGESP